MIVSKRRIERNVIRHYKGEYEYRRSPISVFRSSVGILYLNNRMIGKTSIKKDFINKVYEYLIQEQKQSTKIKK